MVTRPKTNTPVSSYGSDVNILVKSTRKQNNILL